MQLGDCEKCKRTTHEGTLNTGDVRCKMIRIISRIKYQGKCDVCGIGIICEKEDVTNVQVGMNELGNFVECPICGAKIRVTEYTEQMQKRSVGR